MQTQNSEARALAMVVSPEFADGFLTTLSSVLAFSKDRRFSIYLGQSVNDPVDGIVGRAKEVCRHFGFPEDRIQILDVDESRFAHLQPQPNGRHLTYIKLHLATFIREASVLLLDADLLVLDDVDKLLDRFEACDQPLAAVQDRFVKTHGDDSYLLDGKKHEPQDPYFNAGLLLLRSEHCRQSDLCGQIDAAHRRISDLGYTDQTYLNHIYRNGWEALPERWNKLTIPDWPARPFSESSPAAVLHFITSDKPWRVMTLDMPNLLWHHLSREWGVTNSDASLQLAYQDEIADYHRRLRPWQRLIGIYHGLRKPKSRRHQLQKRALGLAEELQCADRWLAANGIRPIPVKLSR